MVAEIRFDERRAELQHDDVRGGIVFAKEAVRAVSMLSGCVIDASGAAVCSAFASLR